MARYMKVSAMEVLILSVLARSKKGVTPTELAQVCKMARASIYTGLRRLGQRKLAIKAPAPNAASSRNVVWTISDRGRAAREGFAQSLGLRP